jgi:hypothetical protein
MRWTLNHEIEPMIFTGIESIQGYCVYDEHGGTAAIVGPEETGLEPNPEMLTMAKRIALTPETWQLLKDIEKRLHAFDDKQLLKILRAFLKRGE